MTNEQRKYADAVRLLVETANAEAKRLSAKAPLSTNDARALAALAQALFLLGRRFGGSRRSIVETMAHWEEQQP